MGGRAEWLSSGIKAEGNELKERYERKVKDIVRSNVKMSLSNTELPLCSGISFQLFCSWSQGKVCCTDCVQHSCGNDAAELANSPSAHT